MDIFNELFSSLFFNKVKEIHIYDMYAAKIESYIGNGIQYVILLSHKNNQLINDEKKIYELQWVSLQTRTLQEDFGIPLQSLNYKTFDARYAINKVKLNLINRTQTQTNYNCYLPIEISLLHIPSKKTIYQYVDEIELRTALKTFQCIIKINI